MSEPLADSADALREEIDALEATLPPAPWRHSGERMWDHTIRYDPKEGGANCRVCDLPERHADVYCKLRNAWPTISAALKSKDAEIAALTNDRDCAVLDYRECCDIRHRIAFERDEAWKTRDESRSRLAEAVKVIETLLVFGCHSYQCPGGTRCTCHKSKARAFLKPKEEPHAES